MAPALNGIGLASADMATSPAFHRRLGLDLPAEADDEPHVEATLPGGIRLMGDTHALIRGFDLDARSRYMASPWHGGVTFRRAAIRPTMAS